MVLNISPAHSSASLLPPNDTPPTTPTDGDLAVVRGTLYDSPEIYRYYGPGSVWEAAIPGVLGKAPDRGIFGCELHWYNSQTIQIQLGSVVSSGTGPRWFVLESSAGTLLKGDAGVGTFKADFAYGSGGYLATGWYRVYVFASTELNDYFYVLSQEIGITGVVYNVNSNTTDFPNGYKYEYRRKIGVVYYDVGTGFRKFIQAGGIPTVEYLWMSFENNAGYQVLANGSNTSGTTFSVSTFCPEEGRFARIFYKAEYISGTPGNVYIYPPSAGGNGHAIAVSSDNPVAQGELIIQPSASEELGYFCQYGGLRCSVWMKSTIMLEPY